MMSRQKSQTAGDPQPSGNLPEFKARFFKALSHPTRIRILEILARGSKTVYELQEALALEQPAVSQQLAVLRNHGVVTSEKEGLVVRYTLRDPLIAELLQVARQIFNNHFISTRELLRQLQRESQRAPRRTTP
jgi:ArsR family transcriptional regulator